MKNTDKNTPIPQSCKTAVVSSCFNYDVQYGNNDLSGITLYEKHQSEANLITGEAFTMYAENLKNNKQ